MAETILTGTSACQGCVISCGRVVSIKEGPYATDGKVKGPEYETICSFGSQLLVDDLAQITALGNLCDRLGLDTISAGNTIALAYLLFDQGIIGSSDTGRSRSQMGRCNALVSICCPAWREKKVLGRCWRKEAALWPGITGSRILPFR